MSDSEVIIKVEMSDQYAAYYDKDAVNQLDLAIIRVDNMTANKSKRTFKLVMIRKKYCLIICIMFVFINRLKEK